jgi:4-amino-4-deoxy-L-arabinose transferase-like glycosyltransferase
LPAGVDFAFGDSESYWVLGHQIARGEPYQFGGDDARVFRTPGYPLLLAGLFAVAGEQPPVLWARALGAVLGTLAVGGVYWLTRLLFDQPAALLGTGLTAVYPGAVAMSVFVLSEALFCPLILGQFIAWILAWRANRKVTGLAWAVVAGITAGAATLVRPSWLLFTPLAVAVALTMFGERRRQLRLSAIMLAAMIIAMSPWWVRNRIVVSRFVPTTLQVGASLYDGLNPRATGASNMWWDKDDPAVPQDEHSRDRQLRDEAVSWAHQNPGRVLELAGVKFLRMWNVWPNEPSLGSWPFRLALMMSYVPMAALAACGAWIFSRRGWPYAVCWLPAVYFTGLHMIFVSSIRYRRPAMLTLIVLAAGAAVVGQRKRSQGAGDRSQNQ